MWRSYFTLRMLLMLLLAFASGLPFSLTGSTLQLWYAQAGVSIVGLGALSLVALPYAYKFLWAPFFDRYVPPLFGRRRGWILITQVCLIVAIIGMALLSPQVHPMTLAIVAVFVAFFSASQDISLDAYRTDVLTGPERGPGSAVWSYGWRVGAIVSGAGALLAASAWGWHMSYWLMAGCVLIGIITTLLAPEPKTDHLIPDNLRAASMGALRDFFTRPYAWGLFIFIILYKLGDAYAQSLTSVFFYRVIGFSLQEVAWVAKTFGLTASMLGVFLAGAIMSRWTLYRALWVFGVLQSISLLGLIAQYWLGKTLWVYISVVFFENITSGMGTIAFTVFLMALCNKRYTATHYAFFSAIMVLGRSFIGPIAGITVKYCGWELFFFFGFVLSMLGVALLVWLSKRVKISAEAVT